MKVLITGGAGYVGTGLIPVLLNAGHHVTVFDNLSSGLRENLFPEAAFMDGDILDADRLAAALAGKLLEKGDRILHIALGG